MVGVEKDCDTGSNFQAHLSSDLELDAVEAGYGLSVDLGPINYLGPMKQKWKQLAREGHDMPSPCRRKRAIDMRCGGDGESDYGSSVIKKGRLGFMLNKDHLMEPGDGSLKDCSGLVFNLGLATAFEHADWE